jgi:hypothetical protein
VVYAKIRIAEIHNWKKKKNKISRIGYHPVDPAGEAAATQLLSAV